MSLFRAASTVSLFTLISRITGLFRELLIASTFGANGLTDAFNVAFRIPNLLRRLFAEGAFSQAFMPVLATTQASAGDKATRQLIFTVATVLFWILLITCLVGIIGAPLLMWLMASGLTAHNMDVGVVMTRIMFPYIAFMSLCALLSSVLNVYKHFAIPAFTPVLLNLCMIAGAYWGAPALKTWGIEPIYALAAGVMLGGALQLAVQIAAMHRITALQPLPTVAWRYGDIREAWRDGNTKKILTLMLPALLGVGVAQISLLINTQIASHLMTGSVSWLSYADRLMEFPTGMLGVALGVVLMPALAAAKAKEHGQHAYSDLLDWGLRWVLVLALPCALALAVFAKPLVATLYHYGAFNLVDVEQTAMALRCYGAGLLGLIAIKVLAPGYYASQNIKTPVKIAVMVLVMTQLFNLILVPWFAHAGLALSIGLGALVNALCLLRGLQQRGVLMAKAGWAKLTRQVLTASLAMSALLAWLGHALPWTSWPQAPHGTGLRLGALCLAVVLAALVYFGLLALMGLRFKALLSPRPAAAL